VQDQLSEVTFVCPACQLRRLVTIHGRHLSLSCTGRKVHPYNRANTVFKANG
jgi:hypothetical protein